MEPQLFELLTSRLDNQDEMLREIRSTTTNTNEKIIHHENAIWWLKKLNWGMWAVMGALFGVKH